MKNLGEGATDYRNPKLAEAMNVLGLVEKFGVGIAIAQRALAANGNPPAKLRPEPSRVVVVMEPAH